MDSQDSKGTPSRRKFFGSLLGGAAVLGARHVTALPAEVHVPSFAVFAAAWKASPTLATLNTQFEEPYAKWEGVWRGGVGGLGWTGWKVGQDHSFFAAQWVLALEASGAPFKRAPSKKRYFVSATPGAVAEYEPGYMFDIGVREGQRYVAFETLQFPIDKLWASAVASKVQAYRALDAFVKGQL